MTDLDPMAVALRLARALEQQQVPYAIGGALAYGLWGDPRGTHDVDLNLFVDAETLGDALRVLSAAGVSIDVPAALNEAKQGWGPDRRLRWAPQRSRGAPESPSLPSCESRVGRQVLGDGLGAHVRTEACTPKSL